MNDKARIVVRVSQETDKHIREYAAKYGVTVGEAADKLIATACGRRQALATYAAKTKQQASAK